MQQWVYSSGANLSPNGTVVYVVDRHLLAEAKSLGNESTPVEGTIKALASVYPEFEIAREHVFVIKSRASEGFAEFTFRGGESYLMEILILTVVSSVLNSTALQAFDFQFHPRK